MLHPRSLGGFPSSVQREQILLVARDQFRIAVAAADLVLAHCSPIAGGGKLVQLVKALLVMRVRRRGHTRCRERLAVAGRRIVVDVLMRRRRQTGGPRSVCRTQCRSEKGPALHIR